VTNKYDWLIDWYSRRLRDNDYTVVMTTPVLPLLQVWGVTLTTGVLVTLVTPGLSVRLRQLTAPISAPVDLAGTERTAPSTPTSAPKVRIVTLSKFSPYRHPSSTICTFLITNHQPFFHICITLPVESAPLFIPSTSLCSLSSWFTSYYAYHLITVTTFALTICHSLSLSLQT